jgi:ketosteroid isomerase-like protein
MRAFMRRLAATTCGRGATDGPAADTVRAFVAAYNRQEAAAAQALTTPDFTRYSITTTKPMNRGRWRQMWEGFVAAFPDERWEVRSLRSCGNGVYLRVVERGTFRRPWVFPDGTVVEPTGRGYTSDSVILFHLDEQHLITSYLQLTTPGFLAVGLTRAAISAILRNGF